jgi:mannose-6-phosphate isomerase-like protein (cupin superfamily)
LDAERNGARYGGLSLLEADADFGVPSHVHPEANEALVIEQGAGTMRIGSERFPVIDGATLFVPDNIEHGLEAAGTRDLRAVQVYAPSGPEQRFRGMAEASAE